MNPTYTDIAECVKQRHGFVPKTCWIAHVKELNGLPVRVAPNRQSQAARMVPCPPEKRAAIEGCIKYLAKMAEKRIFQCPHCCSHHKFTFERLEKGVWPCNDNPLTPKQRREITNALFLRKLSI
jgi:hypothetical protein